MKTILKWAIGLPVAFVVGWAIGGFIGIVLMVREYERSES